MTSDRSTDGIHQSITWCDAAHIERRAKLQPLCAGALGGDSILKCVNADFKHLTRPD